MSPLKNPINLILHTLQIPRYITFKIGKHVSLMKYDLKKEIHVNKSIFENEDSKMVFLRRKLSINWWSDEFQDVYTAKKSALKRLIPDTNQILFKFKNVLETNIDIRHWGWMFQYPSNRWRQMPSCGNCLEFWSRQFDNSGLQDDALNHSHNMTDFFMEI